MAPMPPAERTGFLETAQRLRGLGRRGRDRAVGDYQEYGDPRLLEELGRRWCAWLDRVERTAPESATPTASRRGRSRRRTSSSSGTPASTGASGWSRAASPPDFPAFVAADKSDVATAFFAWSTRLAARIAAPARPGRRGGALRGARAPASLDAWRTEFLGADGRVTPETQANLVRALTFGLVPDEHRQRAADQLATLVREAGTHLGTGFLATPDLLPVLADAGHLDVAYELLLQDTEPSWLTMIDRGATTIWERWEGIDEDGVAARVAQPLLQGRGDLVPAPVRRRASSGSSRPGRRFRVAPRPGGGLTWAQAEHESPHGRSRWRGSAASGRCSRSTSSSRPAAPPRWCCRPAERGHRPGEHRFQSLLMSAPLADEFWRAAGR